MNIKDIIFDKTCYIVSNDLKEEILSYLSKNKIIFDVHFFSLNEIIDRVYFKDKDDAIYRVSKEFNVSFANARILINNLYYLMYSNKINNEKYAYLLKIKQYLDDNKLLEYDNGFLNYLSRYKIVSDLSRSNELFYKINELLDNRIQFLNLETKNEINIYEFDDSEKEIEFIANEISTLITNKVDPNKIHILNCSEAYYPYIDKIFTMYNIPYFLNTDNCLYDYPYIKNLYKCYNNDMELIFNNEYLELSNKFKSILELSKDKNHFLYLLKNTKFNLNKYANCIKFSNYQTVYLDDHYYFFIGLNNKVFPSYKKDEDYLSDKIKIELGYIPSHKINKLMKDYSINRLTSNSNLIISYRKSDFFNSYMKSDIVSLVTNKEKHISNVNLFSKEYDKLKLTKKLDEFYKYDVRSEELKSLLTKINKDDYKSYDNSYTIVDNKLYKDKILKNYLSVSYSSFEKFNECNYKYYLDSIIKESDSKFSTYIGSLFHHILEKVYDKDFNFEDRVKSFDSEYVLNSKEIILLSNLLEDFKNKISILIDQYNNSNFKSYKMEQNISIKRNYPFNININGYIDKVMLDNNNHAYVVDYKTSELKPTLDYLNYGLKCQLPFYFYLLNYSKEYADKYLVGCYLQNINFKTKSYSDTSKELQLDGYTINDTKLIKDIDNLYESNSFIKGIKPNKNGLGTYAKLFDNNDFNNIIATMDKSINEMIDKINNVDFPINPKIIKRNETTCRFCKYNDICYHSFKDYIDIREELSHESSDMD